MVRKIYLNDGEREIVVVVKTFAGGTRWVKAGLKISGSCLMTPVSIKRVKSSTLSEEIAYWIYELKRKILKQLRKYCN